MALLSALFVRKRRRDASKSSAKGEAALGAPLLPTITVLHEPQQDDLQEEDMDDLQDGGCTEELSSSLTTASRGQQQGADVQGGEAANAGNFAMAQLATPLREGA